MYGNVLFVALLTATYVNAFCTNFTLELQALDEPWGTENATSSLITVPLDFRVSPGIICNETTAAQSPQCPHGCMPPITNGTIIKQSGAVNITGLSDEDKSTLFGFIGKAANTSFPLEASTTMGKSGADALNLASHLPLLGSPTSSQRSSA